jgi:hypothetical protein
MAAEQGGEYCKQIHKSTPDIIYVDPHR